MIEYAAALTATKEKHERIAKAFARDDWKAVHILTKEIAALYTDDKVLFSKLEYLIDTTYTRAWFAAKEDASRKGATSHHVPPF